MDIPCLFLSNYLAVIEDSEVMSLGIIMYSILVITLYDCIILKRLM